MKSIKTFLINIKNKVVAFAKKVIAWKKERANRPPNPKVVKTVHILNRYSLLFHGLLACFLCFIVEVISRRSVMGAFTFVDGHTLAYLYNSFIIFASLSLAYLVRKRALVRFLVSGFWIFLGTVNGCILSKRVTPFGYTDLKCLSDLFAMQNTNYFTAKEAMLVVIAVGCFVAFCVWLFLKGPKFAGKTHKFLSPIMVGVICVMLSLTTKVAQSSNVVATYFSNIAQGYENYGFVYSFSSSVVDRGMSKPADYSEEKIAEIQSTASTEETTVTAENAPNIIVVLLESFIDPTEVNYLNLSEDPIPNFRSLYENYSSGYLTVPVVGAGTANTEFEILTGMSLQYFGTGEYPYKTILKQTDCESIASDLSSIGYGTHVVHNNGGNFYSRANAFSMMGFDTFTSKEAMNIQEYTPLGTWPTDNILINETTKALDATPDQSDLVYTITVQGHGDYPTEKVIENPEIVVSGAADEAANNQWEYYVNEIHEVDKFIGNLTSTLESRDEDTIVVFFGDHLPTMGLTDEDMATGDIYKTKYTTWNNFGMAKEDADVTAYQLLANVTDQMGIHEGTIFSYTQSQSTSPDYSNGLENLQYDLLYGSRYSYGGVDLYPATDLIMGIDEVKVASMWKTSDDKMCISGENFTPWTKVYVNGTKVSTTFVSSRLLRINQNDVADGDTVQADIVGSSSTIFRESNSFTYVDPDVVHETETQMPETTETETTETETDSSAEGSDAQPATGSDTQPATGSDTSAITGSDADVTAGSATAEAPTISLVQ